MVIVILFIIGAVFLFRCAHFCWSEELSWRLWMRTGGRRSSTRLTLTLRTQQLNLHAVEQTASEFYQFVH